MIAVRFGVALGIGLLIGAERERHKRLMPDTVTAGLRTITLVALLGAVGGALAREFGGTAGSLLLVGMGAAVTALIIVGYRHGVGQEPGITTDVAVLLTFFLGALAMYEPSAAASLGVVVAILLVARSPLHTFVTSVLSEQELRDALVLLAATLVVLPLLPDRPIDPLGVFAPSSVWTVAIAVMAIGAAGHVARRTLGSDYGLPVVGLASGFVSSIATVGAMGAEARNHPDQKRAAVGGAALSTLATVIQLAVVVAVADLAVLRALLFVLVPAGLMAAVYGVLFTVRAAGSGETPSADPGRAFELKKAIAFALGVSAVLLVSALVRRYLGADATLAATALAGLADTHSASFSAASLAAQGALTVDIAAFGVLLAFTTNSITKAVVAWVAGDRWFFARVAFGLVLVLGAAWAGALAAGLV
jgi:uncharacterized membrane protein (DUF4010 family)